MQFICIPLLFFVGGTPYIHCSTPPHNLDKRTTITIDDKTFVVEADDLEKICDLGRGAYGIVEKMRHIQTDTVMAVKRITATVNTQEQVSCLSKRYCSRKSDESFYYPRNAF